MAAGDQVTHIHIHLPDTVAGEIMKQLKRHELLLGRILMNQDEQSALELLKAQLAKVNAEYQAQKDEDAAKIAAATAKIEELQGAIAAQVDPAVSKALLDEIQTIVTSLDDKRADLNGTEETAVAE